MTGSPTKNSSSGEQEAPDPLLTPSELAVDEQSSSTAVGSCQEGDGAGVLDDDSAEQSLPTSDQENGTETKRCVHCDSEIRERADTCPVCQKLQNHWRERLNHAGSLVALLSGLLALGLVVFQFYDHTIKRILVGDRLEIAAFRTNGRGTIANLGYRDIGIVSATAYVTFILNKKDGSPHKKSEFSDTFDINRVVKPDSIISVNVGTKLVDISAKIGTRAEISDIINNKASKLTWAVFTENDPHYLHFKQELKDERDGKGLNTFPCKLQLTLIASGESETMSDSTHKCVALIVEELATINLQAVDSSTNQSI